MKRGFTLVEVIVAVALFVMLIFVTSSILTQSLDTSRKTRTQSAVVGNIHVSVETISRTIREGTGYHCGSEGALSTPDLTSCGGSGTSAITVTKRDGSLISFRLADHTIEQSVEGGGWVPLTAPDVTVDHLSFRLVDANIGENEQPKILINARGEAGADAATASDFDVQTTVSQRYLFSTLVEGAVCGNALCEWGESSALCPADCGTGTGGNSSGDIMLVVDTSGSIDAAELSEFKQSLRYAVNTLFERDPGVRVGLVDYANTSHVRQPLTTNRAALINSVNALSANGNTNTPVGLRAALNQFRDLQEVDTSMRGASIPMGSVADTFPIVPSVNRDDTQHPNFVILFTDGATDSYLAHETVTINGTSVAPGGWVNNICRRNAQGELVITFRNEPPNCGDGTPPAFESLLDESTLLKQRAIVFVISIGISQQHIPQMEAVASRDDYHFHINGFNESILSRIIDDIIFDIATPVDCSQCPTGGHCPQVCVALPGTSLQDVDVFEF